MVVVDPQGFQVVWQYSWNRSWDPHDMPEKGPAWRDFTASGSHLTEEAFRQQLQGVELEVEDNKGKYKVDVNFGTMTQRSTCMRYGHQVYRHVRRIVDVTGS